MPSCQIQVRRGSEAVLFKVSLLFPAHHHSTTDPALSLPPAMCIDLTGQHITRSWVFKLGTSLHLLVSQEAGPCADCDKYYSQIFSLVPSDFDK